MNERQTFDAYHRYADDVATDRREQARRVYPVVREIAARRIAEGRDARSFIDRASELLDVIDGVGR